MTGSASGRIVRSASALLVALLTLTASATQASADDDVERRIAAFWARVDALRPTDYLSATDVGQWAKNVTDRDTTAAIQVADFRDATAQMQAAFDAGRGHAPTTVSGPSQRAFDVEQRIADFWKRVGGMSDLEYLAAGDVGQWALNVIDRDPNAAIRTDAFRASTAQMQTAIDGARAALARNPAAVPKPPFHLALPARPATPLNVVTWGYNLRGALGDGTQLDQHTPVAVNSGPVVALANDVAVKSDGTLVAWGDLGGLWDSLAKCDPLGLWPSPVACTFFDSGVRTPVPPPTWATTLTNIAIVVTGRAGRFGIKTDGTMIRLDTTRESPFPQVTRDVVTAAVGSGHVLALRTDGSIAAWGENFYGELGDGTTGSRPVPGRVADLDRVVAIAAGQSFSLAVRDDGSVWAWGNNDFGELGDGTTVTRLTPQQVPGLSRIRAVAAGQGFALALDDSGAVWAWGANDLGELGDGTRANRGRPALIAGLTGMTAIAAGLTSSYAVRGDGTIWAWGQNNFGQLGDGSIVDRAAPVKLAGVQGARSIAATTLVAVAAVILR